MDWQWSLYRGFAHLARSLQYIVKMEWNIERISVKEEAVYLRKPSGVTRKISVPGALNASLEHGRLLIWANTGYLWVVNPDSGHRKREVCGQLGLLETVSA